MGVDIAVESKGRETKVNHHPLHPEVETPGSDVTAESRRVVMVCRVAAW